MFKNSKKIIPNLNIFSENGRENNLSIQSEEDGAPAPWAKTTTGEDDDLSFVPSLFVLRLLFVGGEESIICVQEIKIQCSEIFPLIETLKIRIIHRKLIYFTLVAGEISAQQTHLRAICWSCGWHVQVSGPFRPYWAAYCLVWAQCSPSLG